MERLAEQIVDWHNRHPLARRIRVEDVHTVGVVALPFVRATAQAGAFAEPVLTDPVSAFDELHGSAPVSRWAVGSQRMKGLPQRLRQLFSRQPRTQWRAFSEKFLPGLSARQIERFALAHGFAEAPATPETRPWRVIVIDEKLAGAHGGWPFELYLMSAGIDLGNARTRVLSGRGIPSQIIGRRLWDPLRAGGAAGMLALLLALAAWAAWPRRAAEPAASPPAAASAPMPASGPAPTAEPAHASASAPEPAAEAGAPASAASAPELAASEPEGTASDAKPDIRPHFVQRADGKVLPPLHGGAAREQPAEAPGDKPQDKPADRPPGKAGTKPAEKPGDKGRDKGNNGGDKPPAASAKGEPVDPRLARLATAPEKTAVALVGPPGTRAEAQALLARMKAGLVGVHSNPDSLQADVIQTPDGWRATVWPFANREQAQLINATLVARGMKTKAVNF